MKTGNIEFDSRVELTRLDRVVLHLRCLWRDHKLRWHLAVVLREVTLH